MGAVGVPKQCLLELLPWMLVLRQLFEVRPSLSARVWLEEILFVLQTLVMFHCDCGHLLSSWSTSALIAVGCG